jgi:hypothetical protein
MLEPGPQPVNPAEPIQRPLPVSESESEPGGSGVTQAARWGRSVAPEPAVPVADRQPVTMAAPTVTVADRIAGGS